MGGTSGSYAIVHCTLHDGTGVLLEQFQTSSRMYRLCLRSWVWQPDWPTKTTPKLISANDICPRQLCRCILSALG